MRRPSEQLKQHITRLRTQGKITKRIRGVYLVKTNNKGTNVLRFNEQIIPERLSGLILRGTPLGFKHKYRRKLKVLSKKYVQGKPIKNITQNDLTIKLPQLLFQLHKRRFSNHKYGKLGKVRKWGTYFDALYSTSETILKKIPSTIPKKYVSDFHSIIHTIQEISIKDKSLKERKDFCLINRDLTFDNIVRQQNGKLRIIDFGAAGIGDPAEDIAKMCSKLNLTKKQRDIFIGEYQKLTQDFTIKRRTQLYLAIEEIRRAYVNYSGKEERLKQGIQKAKEAINQI